MTKYTQEDITKFTRDIPPPEDLERYSRYGDYVRELQSNLPVIGYNEKIIELRELIKKQALDSLNELYRLRKEKPIAVEFWEDQGRFMLKFGWFAWTDKKK